MTPSPVARLLVREGRALVAVQLALGVLVLPGVAAAGYIAP